MRSLLLMSLIALCLSGCRTSRDDNQIEARWDNAASYTRSHTYEVTGTTFTKDLRAFVNSKPMELVSIVITYKTAGTSTTEMYYTRDGYKSQLPPNVTWTGTTHVRLLEAPLMLKTGRNTGDIIEVVETRGGTWQVTLNFK